MQSLEFYAGEKRRITLEVKSEDESAFTIHDASWQLKKFEVVKTEGEGTICDHDVIIFIDVPEDGSYILEVTYHIGEEVIKNKIGVRVR